MNSINSTIIKVVGIGVPILLSGLIVATSSQIGFSQSEPHIALERAINHHLPNGPYLRTCSSQDDGCLSRELGKRNVLRDIVDTGNYVCGRGRVTQNFLDDISGNKDGKFAFDRMRHCAVDRGTWRRFMISGRDRLSIRKNVDDAVHGNATEKEAVLIMKRACRELGYRDMPSFDFILEPEVYKMRKHGRFFHELDHCISEEGSKMERNFVHSVPLYQV